MGVDGKYSVMLDSPLARSKATLEFASQGSKLSGKISGVMETMEFNGAVDGAKVSWTMEGVIAASYSYKAKWECIATIQGDAIRGEMTVGEPGTFPFSGTRITAENARAMAEEGALPWKDLGLPRYEAISVEWVNALKAYVKEKTKGKTCDFELVWSIEYTNPPAHLLRGDGRDFIGYHWRAKNGKFEVFDGPVETAVIRTIYPYYPIAVHLRMNTNDYTKWAQEHGAEVRDQVKTIGASVELGKRVNQFMGGANNDIREEFLSQQTA